MVVIVRIVIYWSQYRNNNYWSSIKQKMFDIWLIFLDNVYIKFETFPSSQARLQLKRRYSPTFSSTLHLPPAQVVSSQSSISVLKLAFQMCLGYHVKMLELPNLDIWTLVSCWLGFTFDRISFSLYLLLIIN